MSMDYQIYLNKELSTSFAERFEFVADDSDENILRGVIFNGSVEFIMIPTLSKDDFLPEEMGCDVKAKIILSPNIDRYDESMAGIIRVLSACVSNFSFVRFYQENERLLLEKKKEIIIFNEDWWEYWLDEIDFPCNKKWIENKNISPI